LNNLNPVLEPLKDSLMDLACQVTGFRRDALRVGAIEKMVQERASAASWEELAKDISAGSPTFISQLAEAVTVGETYFFREPEHLRFLEEKVLPSFSGCPLRAWSAGCATGEETYSLVACLMAGGVKNPGILGTDLAQKQLETAQKGDYPTWSLRGAGEMYPLFEAVEGQVLKVAKEFKEAARFMKHNLLDPLPAGEGPFDVVFCRNVLVYFTPEAARQVLENLAQALVPEGLLFLGPADIPFAPPGFKPYGPAELSIYQKSPAPNVPLPEKPSPAAKAHTVTKSASLPFKKENPVSEITLGKSLAIALHLRALEAVEKEEETEAGRLLGCLRREFPDYLPGLYEIALWNVRRKKKAAAEELMRELLKKLKGKSKSRTIPGPQSLTAGFYRVSAQAFLARKDER